MSICKKIIPGILIASIAFADQEERQDEGRRWLLSRQRQALRQVKRTAPQRAAQQQEQEELQKAVLSARKYQQDARDALNRIVNPAGAEPVKQLTQTAEKELSVKDRKSVNEKLADILEKISKKAPSQSIDAKAKQTVSTAAAVGTLQKIEKMLDDDQVMIQQLQQQVPVYQAQNGISGNGKAHGIRRNGRNGTRKRRNAVRNWRSGRH